MADIKLSPKHGLNPSIPLCFFCGRPKDEIVFLGKLKNDQEAPMHCIIDMEPCDECKKSMAMGITLIGTDDKPVQERQPAIGENLYLTGDFIVISEEFARHIFKPENIEAILTDKKALVPQQLIQDINDEAEKSGIEIPHERPDESESE